AGETFSRLYICSVMTEADAEKIHGTECVCAENVIPQRRVKAALNPIMQSAATRFGAIRRKYRPCRIAASSNQTAIAATTCTYGRGSSVKKRLAIVPV